MLSEALTVLATTSGTAVIQAAGTDAWTGLRERVARLFGRRSERAEQATLERLDRTAAELEGATDDMSIRADGGSVAAGVIHGGVTLGPSQPGRSQG